MLVLVCIGAVMLVLVVNVWLHSNKHALYKAAFGMRTLCMTYTNMLVHGEN